jgi:hypothetical protein
MLPLWIAASLPLVPWFRDESLWIAVSNLVLVALVAILAVRNEHLGRMLGRATRKLLVGKRTNKAVRYALKVTVHQYHSLRRKFDRRRPLVAPTPVASRPPPAAFIVPPPLDLAPPAGDEPSSWSDSGLLTAHRPSTLPPDDTGTREIRLTDTQPLPIDQRLIKLSRTPH